MALNRVILFGRLTRDPEMRNTSSGIAVTRFTVACDRQFVNKQTNERECDFIECEAWRNTAEFVSKWCHKGSAITVEGSLRNNNFTDTNGVKHYGYVVSADNVGFGGSKNNSAQSSTEQTGTAQSAQQSEPLNIGELGEFEQIVSNGEVPF